MVIETCRSAMPRTDTRSAAPAPDPIQNGDRSTTTGSPSVGATGTKRGDVMVRRSFSPAPSATPGGGRDRTILTAVPNRRPIRRIACALGGVAPLLLGSLSAQARPVKDEPGERHLANVRQLTFSGN